MKLIRATIDGLFYNKVDALGLAIFRMLFAVMLFCEAIHFFEFRQVVYDRIPFQVIPELKYELFFGFWIFTLVLLFFGLFTRLATILSYIFAVMAFSSTSAFEYHVFYTYVGVSFFMMFMPVSRVFSIDSVIRTAKYSSIGRTYTPDRNVLAINYMIPVFVGVGLVYFDSVFLKLGSPMWLSGLGVWLPSSVPPVVWNDTSWILNCKPLIIFLGYFVLIFEALFLFAFWFRRLWFPIVAIGVMFHVGIYISYPIPLFALTYIIIYLLLVPPHYWTKLGNFFKSKAPVYQFYYDAECPICIKTISLIRQVDVFNRVECLPVQTEAAAQPALSSIDPESLLIDIHGVTRSGKVVKGYDAYMALFRAMLFTYPLGLLFSLPGLSSIGRKVYRKIAGNRLTERCTIENCNLPVFEKTFTETDSILVDGWSQINASRGFWKWSVILLLAVQSMLIAMSYTKSPVLHSIARPAAEVFSKFLGLGRHDVFLEQHFRNFNHMVRLEYVDPAGTEHLIPLIDDRGMVAEYNSGIIWRNMSFNVVTPNLDQQVLAEGLEPYFRHYLNDKGIADPNPSFRIYVMEFDTPTQWEKDFLKKQMRKPWFLAGQCELGSRSATYTWTPQMMALFSAE